ncbi:phage holin family protein [Georgenia wutianyii]|uniref:Phage holin family protein n=1 Tax=Georgenia wutianyii TaxID=2585135 RepID=A0ABX5VPR1_9MICO|nr:phage holin family protein [Georgenia wutianyii]QDB80499.1 phage holin family protein [Georgenia wutianyii]
MTTPPGPPPPGGAAPPPGTVPPGHLGTAVPAVTVPEVPTSEPLPSSDTSIGELVSNITQDFSTLVRQEMDLAKAELTQSVSKASKGAGMFGGAGLAGYFTLLFLSLALWWALGTLIADEDTVPALGWSALIVAAIWAVVAAVLALTGRKEMKEVEGLPLTSQTVKKIPDAVRGQDH